MTEQINEASPCETLEQLNLIIDNLGDSISVKNREHRFVYVNEVFVRVTGFAHRDDIIGKTVCEIFPNERATTLREQEEQIFQSGQESLSDEEYNDAEGHPHVNRVRKTVIEDPQGNKLMIVLSRDVTENRQMRSQLAQAQKMESLGLFASKIAHDFNNLLNVINGYCEMILEDMDEDDSVREDIEKISEAGQSAAALTAQLQVLGQKPKQSSQKERLNLNEIIEDDSPMLAQLVGEDVHLIKELDSAVGVISTDPRELRQILMNLTANAKDAMPDGGSMTVTTINIDVNETWAKKHPLVNAGSFACLSVKDDGVGMDETTRDRLFEPFFTTKGKGKGTGLGLSSVYGIVKQNGGFIEVWSKPGKGSEFKIYFPVENQ